MAYPVGPPPWPPPGAPVSAERTDRAYKWFVAYAAVLTLLYLSLAVGAFVALVLGVGSTEPDAEDVRVTGATMTIVFLAIAVVHGVGLFLPRRSWGWVYGLVLISLGMTSCITWPATIPLLISWVKPGMKARFRAT